MARPAICSLASGLVATTAGTAAGLLSAGSARPGHLASVMAGVAVAAGLGYPLSAPRPAAPGRHRAHGQQEQSVNATPADDSQAIRADDDDPRICRDIEPVLPGGPVSACVPDWTRMWNCWLGGKDHYPADRDAAARYAACSPPPSPWPGPAATSLPGSSATSRARRASAISSISAPGCRSRNPVHEVAQRAAVRRRVRQLRRQRSPRARARPGAAHRPARHHRPHRRRPERPRHPAGHRPHPARVHPAEPRSW